MNLNYIELRNVNNKNITDNTDKEIESILFNLQLNKMKVSSICTVIGKPTVKEYFNLQVLKLHKSLKISNILGAEHIRIFSEINCSNSDFKTIVNELSDIYKVKICLENKKYKI